MTSALVPLTLAAATAGPNGATVVGGSATVQGQGTANVVVNQTSQSAVVNWNTFNIGAGETTRINMPSPSSVELDRVTGGLGPSQILGSLSSNGRVFLVNPDGILFGAGSRVNVGGLLATTHDISNADFMAGRYNFSISGNPSASIVNQGSITAQTGGFAALVAPGVRNTGTITATLGTIALASGSAFTLDLYGDQLIKLGVNDSIASQVIDVSTGKPLSSLVSNEGTLKANGGRVELTAVAARKVVDSVIRNTGVIEANTIGSHNGMIVLGAATRATKPSGVPTQTVKVSGTLSAASNAKGTTGGTIVVTGEDIQVSNANINVSGSTGGGALLIGGDWGGGHPNTSLVSNASAYLEPYTVPTASTVSVDAATTINASTTNTGNGGKVVIWSDVSTKVYGSILATGGAAGGNGGFIETSGGTLDFTGARANTSAPSGKIGTWLLDPIDLIIDGTAASAVDSALATTNVILQTYAVGAPSGPTGSTGNTNTSGAGNIIIDSGISWTSLAGLTLDAYNNIVLNAPISGSLGGLVINANNTIAASAAVNVGSFTLQNGAWNQVSPTLSTFFANNFQISGGSFLRAAGGNGTSGSPYQITDVYGLQGIGSSPTLLAANYVLANSFNASATASWNGGAGFVPIGNNSTTFSGTFNGNGNTISNLSINRPASDYVGLFGFVGASGQIENLGLLADSVGGNADVGGLIGVNHGMVTNTYSTGAVTGFSQVGGLVGLNDGMVTQSHATGHVQGTGGDDVGGLVGWNFEGNITQSYASANVSGPLDVGGLVGDNRSTITQSYATGVITGTNTQFDFGVGGLVGYMNDGGSITQSYATGPVSAPSYVGGLVGFTGLGTITQSYSIGKVIGSTNFGGLIGYNSGTTVTSSYWDTLTSGIPTISAGGTPIADTTLKNNLPSGFSSAVWGVNSAYPFLLWQKINTALTSSSVPSQPPAQNQINPSSPTPPSATQMQLLIAQIEMLVVEEQLTVAEALQDLAAIGAIDLNNATQRDGYIFPTSMLAPGAELTSAEKQCAVLVQALIAGLDKFGTAYWAPVGQSTTNPKGQTLQSGSAKPGDPIATFMANGYYPVGNESMNMVNETATISNQPHSGIFLSYLPPNGTPVGFAMLAQSDGQPATVEYRLFQQVPSSSPYSGYPVEHFSYSVISTTPAAKKNPYSGP